MRKKRQISHIEDFQVGFVGTPSSEVRIPTLCGLHVVTSFKRVQYGKEE